MSFTQSTFAPIGAHSSDTPNLFSYKTLDTLSDVLKSEYFIAKVFQLETGDFMLIQASDQSAFCEVDSTNSGVFLVTAPNDKTAFGVLKSESESPITQISARYGLLNNVLTVTDNDLSGSNSVVDEKFTCQSGTDAAGLASILTLRQLVTRPGQGAVARFPAIFSPGLADVNQGAGLITAQNLFTFGFVGTAFGILYVRDGRDELQELTLTVAASGAETATVTIDDNDHDIGLTGTSGLLANDAYELAVGLNAAIPNYNFSSNGATVVAQSVLPGAAGSFAYSSSGVSAGTWDQLHAGADGIPLFIAQEDWNFDTRLEGDENSILNPLFNNIYQIQLNGSVDFFIEDKDTKKAILVHRLKLTNTDTLNTVSNAAFRVGWIVRNVGNTSNVTVQGSYASAFIEGKIYYDTPPQGASNNQSVTAGNDQISVLIIRNRISFGDKVNRAEVLPLVLNAASQATKFAFFKLLLNPTFATPVNFAYVEKDSSLVEISKDAVVVTGGSEVGGVTVEAGAPASKNFNETMNRTTAIFPGGVLALVAQIPTGGSSDCQGDLTWQEDL